MKGADSLRSAPVQIDRLIIAGWTGRDQAALEHHIKELEALGVKRPATTPCYYSLTPDLLTTEPEVSFLGGDGSGEVEFVILSLDDGLWVGLGSDHTDRKLETVSVSFSKQVCAKPIGPQIWRFDDVAPHWDRLELRSYATIGGKEILYQEGLVSKMRAPVDLMHGAPGSINGRLPSGSAMYCGTFAAMGGIRPADRFRMQLFDPVLNRSLHHTYAVNTVAITGE